MTPPECNTAPRLVDEVEWPKYRLQYLASPEGCVFQTASNASDTVPPVGLVRMTNTSDETIQLSFVAGGGIQPKAIWDAEYPEQILDWDRVRALQGVELTTVDLVPGETREFGPTRLLHSLMSGRFMSGRSLMQPMMPVDYTVPRRFFSQVEFVIRMGGADSQAALRRRFQSEMMLRYVPLPEDDGATSRP